MNMAASKEATVDILAANTVLTSLFWDKTDSQVFQIPLEQYGHMVCLSSIVFMFLATIGFH